MSVEALNPTARPECLYQVRILDHRPIAQHQWSILVKPDEAELPEFAPGNFCMLSFLDRVDPVTPRPFAIVERKEGAYQLIYRLVGKFTSELVKIPTGSRLGPLGPLGRGFAEDHFRKGRHVFIAGGVGYASLLPLLYRYQSQNEVAPIVSYGLRTEIEVIRRAPYPCLYASDDGSLGFNGRISALVKEKEPEWRGADFFYVCGSSPMMKSLYPILPPERSFYFLEESMGCGVGICMGCVVPIPDEQSGEVKYVRSCLEGSMFRGDRLGRWYDPAGQVKP